MLIEIAGVRLYLETDAETEATLRGSWPEFVVDEGPAVDLLVRITRLPAVPPGRKGALRVARRNRTLFFYRRDFTGVLAPDEGQALIEYHGELPYLSSALRVMCALFLAGDGGCMFHASSVRTDEGAYLFPGPSGTGKTTLARLGQPRGVLSDEISAVRFVAGEAVAFPTPFWGEMVRVRAAPRAKLRGIGLLRRAMPMTIEPASPPDAFVGLAESALFFGNDQELKSRLVDTLAQLARAVPVFELRYRLPGNPWRLLDGSSDSSSARTVGVADVR